MTDMTSKSTRRMILPTPEPVSPPARPSSRTERLAVYRQHLRRRQILAVGAFRMACLARGWSWPFEGVDDAQLEVVEVTPPRSRAVAAALKGKPAPAPYVSIRRRQP